MGWIKRVEDEHKCDKPVWDSKVRRGDIWQCEDPACRIQYRVSEVKVHFDQRDGDWGTITWALYNLLAPSHDPGVTSWRDR